MNKLDDSNPFPDEDPIDLDTETRRSSWIRLVERTPLLLGVVAFSGALFYAPPDILMILGVVAFDCLLLTLTLWAPRRHPRGAWRLDHDGVAFQPRFGSCIYLRWADVEWVWFARQSVSLEADGEVVTIPWVWLKPDEVSRSRGLIEYSLSGEFDLSPDPLKQWSAGRPMTLRHVALLSCIALATITCWVAGGLWIVTWSHLPVSLQKHACSLWTVILMASVSSMVERRRVRERKRLFPRWPWRGRRRLLEDVHSSS